jgi:formylglycine-generating enzyme required for sulfatase activity
MRSSARFLFALGLVFAAFVASAAADASRTGGSPGPAPALAEAASIPSVAEVPGAVASACPSDMVLVEGDYCTEVRQSCLDWEDPPTRPFARCARFAPSECIGKRVHKRFCIDRDEYAKAGDTLPLGGASWSDARRDCESVGKRLCFETEWELACEGDRMLPYPTGYVRDASACNVDKDRLVDASGKLRDQREPPAALERCVSSYGVRNMVGNVDEWVVRDRTAGEWRSALKGGWWMPGRDRCRPATTAHGETFRGVQTGFRCCL